MPAGGHPAPRRSVREVGASCARQRWSVHCQSSQPSTRPTRSGTTSRLSAALAPGSRRGSRRLDPARGTQPGHKARLWQWANGSGGDPRCRRAATRSPAMTTPAHRSTPIRPQGRAAASGRTLCESIASRPSRSAEGCQGADRAPSNRPLRPYAARVAFPTAICLVHEPTTQPQDHRKRPRTAFSASCETGGCSRYRADRVSPATCVASAPTTKEASP